MLAIFVLSRATFGIISFAVNDRTNHATFRDWRTAMTPRRHHVGLRVVWRGVVDLSHVDAKLVTSRSRPSTLLGAALSDVEGPFPVPRSRFAVHGSREMRKHSGLVRD